VNGLQGLSYVLREEMLSVIEKYLGLKKLKPGPQTTTGFYSLPPTEQQKSRTVRKVSQFRNKPDC